MPVAGCVRIVSEQRRPGLGARVSRRYRNAQNCENEQWESSRTHVTRTSYIAVAAKTVPTRFAQKFISLRISMSCSMTPRFAGVAFCEAELYLAFQLFQLDFKPKLEVAYGQSYVAQRQRKEAGS